MSRQIKGLLYFFVTDLRYSFIIFWSILTAVNIVSLITSYLLLNVTDSFMYLTNSIATYIYVGILGFITVKESLPFSLKMGATRKSYFLSIGTFFVGLSFFLATLENIYHIVLTSVNKALGIDNFYLFHLASLVGKGDSLLYRFSIDVFILFFGLSSMFLLGLVFHRYGQIGGLGILGVLVILLLVFAGTGGLMDLIKTIISNPSFHYFTIIFAIGLVFYGVSWAILHNVSAKSARAS
ncbi:hypothetical protein [Aquibacillus kalidii]|uniref:hypothetical protein n=1 Tax=Aquibacillus kalidii TaxID=2762597 RepID=UPI001644EF08|nr:hypothetical protein [Aquibacillus kalidii]